ncbi:hypothetical protein KSZ_10860 [Dictyobacter formicarum]|uniref:Uncharacterized protein n=1 Tax=Dictyobacter formicarum TaxID=2778368 RepID=A0ABQ3VAV2_9CHLR|nr:hypothetical protein KSZ_10860 [Dictyobacter formicarum]
MHTLQYIMMSKNILKAGSFRLGIADNFAPGEAASERELTSAAFLGTMHTEIRMA